MGKVKIQNLVLLLILVNIAAVLTWLFDEVSINVYLNAVCAVGLFSLFLLFGNNNIQSLILKILIFVLLLIGFLNKGTYYFQSILIDIGAFAFLTVPLMFQVIETEKFKKLLLSLAAILFLYFFFTLQYIDLTLITQLTAESRNTAFHSLDEVEGMFGRGRLIYTTQQLVVSSLFLILLLLPLIKDRLSRNNFYFIIIASIIIILLFASFYQKRQQILELGIIIFIYTFIYNKVLDGFLPKNILISFFTFTIIVYIIFQSNYFDNIFTRFSLEFEAIDDFSRFKEIKTVILANFLPIDYILGKGIGSHNSDAFSSGTVLHVGYANFLFKGGFVLLFYVIFNLIYNIVYCLKRIDSNKLFVVGIGISLFSIIQLFYSPGYHWYFTTIITGMGLYSRYFIKNIKQTSIS